MSAVSLDIRQGAIDDIYARRIAAAMFLVVAPVSAAAYSVSIRGHFSDSVLFHATMLLSTRAVVAGLLGCVSPHEPTGGAATLALGGVAAGPILSLLAALDRYAQPSNSDFEHTIRVGVATVPIFLWLWFLHGYYWSRKLAAWEGFRLCAAGTNCTRLLGLLLLRSYASPPVEFYPPGQLPFEAAFACNLALILLIAALTPPNRTRLALFTGFHTVNLSQLPISPPPELGEEQSGLDDAAANAQSYAQPSAKPSAQPSECPRRCSSAASQQSHDSLGAELPGLLSQPLGLDANVGLRYRTPSARSERASQRSAQPPLLSHQMERRLESSLSQSGLSSTCTSSDDCDISPSSARPSCSEGSRYGVIPE